MILAPQVFLALGATIPQLALASRCSPASIGKPELPGAKILSIQAEEAHNYSAVSLGPGTNEGDRYTISFCNVTVTHTHPSWNDKINTQVWLPLERWNDRFQALGGGGYSTGFGSIYLTYAVSKGFASASTDGGHAQETGTDTIPTDLSWALDSKGGVDCSPERLCVQGDKRHGCYWEASDPVILRKSTKLFLFFWMLWWGTSRPGYGPRLS